MKTKLSISIVVLALFGIVATQIAVAQSSNSSPAQEALKGVRHFIGSWAAAVSYTHLTLPTKA